jgi:hypothetical protein
VEVGTRFISPKPFLRPALDESTTEIMAKIRENLSFGIVSPLIVLRSCVS